MCGPIYFFHAHFLRLRAVGTGGGGQGVGNHPSYFGRSVNIISIKVGGRLCPPIFSILPTALCVVPMIDDVAKTGRTNSMKVYV